MHRARRNPPGDTRPTNGELDALHASYAATRSAALRAELAHWYTPFAYHLANRFRDRGEPLDDLRQVALTALVVALDRFDPAMRVRFTTYGTRCITGELKRHFRDKGWAVRVGRSAQERYLRLRAETEALHHELGRSPTIAEVAARLGVDEEAVLAAMDVGDARRAASLDAPAAGRDDGLGVDIGRVDPGFDSVEQTLVHRQVLDALLTRLSDTDRRLVELYYLEGHTQMEVAHLTGTSQVSVSRHLARVLSRLRTMAHAGAVTAEAMPVG
jgi:RNA polymerase sigma-B factor